MLQNPPFWWADFSEPTTAVTDNSNGVTTDSQFRGDYRQVAARFMLVNYYNWSRFIIPTHIGARQPNKPILPIFIGRIPIFGYKTPNFIFVNPLFFLIFGYKLPIFASEISISVSFCHCHLAPQTNFAGRVRPGQQMQGAWSADCNDHHCDLTGMMIMIVMAKIIIMVPW